MPITYPLSLPAGVKIRSAVWNKRSIVSTAPSEFTLSEQIQVYAGQRWEGVLAFPPMKRDTAILLESFILSLNGKEGSFLLGPLWHTAPEGVGGSGLVMGSGQTGRELITDDWAPSTLVLKAGDFFQIGSGVLTRLHMVLEDVTSDGFGVATLQIWPRLRESPNDNEPLVLTNPKGTFRLGSNIIGLDVSVAATFESEVPFTEKVP